MLIYKLLIYKLMFEQSCNILQRKSRDRMSNRLSIESTNLQIPGKFLYDYQSTAEFEASSPQLIKDEIAGVKELSSLLSSSPRSISFANS